MVRRWESMEGWLVSVPEQPNMMEYGHGSLNKHRVIESLHELHEISLYCYSTFLSIVTSHFYTLSLPGPLPSPLHHLLLATVFLPTPLDFTLTSLNTTIAYSLLTFLSHPYSLSLLFRYFRDVQQTQPAPIQSPLPNLPHLPTNQSSPILPPIPVPSLGSIHHSNPLANSPPRQPAQALALSLYAQHLAIPAWPAVCTTSLRSTSLQETNQLTNQPTNQPASQLPRPNSQPIYPPTHPQTCTLRYCLRMKNSKAVPFRSFHMGISGNNVEEGREEKRSERAGEGFLWEGGGAGVCD
ncbi:hypothetical protein BU26DRAFT_172075 [Trematosphaeria pertusa]|uniref:Uncharacterized protein n=1 Tax=Trematosphaeria pertusa TaxID=390896 RepID=A0A6A6HWY8_9PLEO|nr:uncharacterized protein BU26DRAFT_172075 [Trematosphaeria pertusa]KAF2241890.1 hypothetical protein BU26DRAFT_172075 [Trematosphaeria pertusa]